MGRYTGPVCRRCRREGMKLFLKGGKCYMAKCPVDAGRPAPGMHGQRRVRKMSDYGMQLREKQKLRRQYGLQENQFKLFFKRASRQHGVTGETLLQLLETRLDNVIYRLGLAPSRQAARQFVTHNHVTVNNRKASIPSMTVKTGSIVQVRDDEGSRAYATRSLEMATGREKPSWMSFDEKTFAAQVLRIPTRDEIAPVVEEHLVVELYSK